MPNASRDLNRVTTLLGALNTDGITPTTVYVNSSNHSLKVVDSNTGSDFGVTDAPRDENRIPVALVSSSTGVITELYADSSHNLLIQST